jgi:hypothetical protein
LTASSTNQHLVVRAAIRMDVMLVNHHENAQNVSEYPKIMKFLLVKTAIVENR